MIPEIRDQTRTDAEPDFCSSFALTVPGITGKPGWQPNTDAFLFEAVCAFSFVRVSCVFFPEAGQFCKLHGCHGAEGIGCGAGRNTVGKIPPSL